MEDLVQQGKASSGCPYYAARDMAEDSDIIFCPYNYIIDPRKNNRFFVKSNRN